MFITCSNLHSGVLYANFAVMAMFTYNSNSHLARFKVSKAVRLLKQKLPRLCVWRKKVWLDEVNQFTKRAKKLNTIIYLTISPLQTSLVQPKTMNGTVQ